MNSTILRILIIGGITVIILAVRFGIFKIIDKAGNAIDKKIVDHKNANHPAETIRLADLYPDFVATLQKDNHTQNQ